ncbi:hypothetical protein IJJ02_02785 [Candidatus Saccharibacteria bacterium]|nr:hypothetical protein [Candidatus Saccharibacteria bacterium]
MVKKRSKKRESFRRIYREDLKRDLNVPEMGEHIVKSFQMIFKNWKLFLPLLLMAMVILLLTVGTTGFLKEAAGVFIVLVFLILWLVTIWFARQIMAKHKVKFRDGLYNAMTPLISTFVVFAVAIVECIPIFLLVIAYSAAIETGFLTAPFYALLFWVFAALMVTISCYLLSSSLIALLAVTVPGVYPFKALVMATELMRGRKVRFVLRILVLVLVLGVIFTAIVLPLSALKVPPEVLSIIVELLACFGIIYMATYLYIYYRYLLNQ